MRFSAIVCASAVAFGSLAVAEDCVAIALKVIPQCAQSCFLNGAPSIGCAGTDFQCQCQSQAKLFAAVEGCVQTACPAESYQPVIDGATTVCDCAAGLTAAAATSNSTVVPSNTVMPTSTTKPTTVPTGAAGRPAVGGIAKEVGILAGVFGTTLFAAIAL